MREWVRTHFHFGVPLARLCLSRDGLPAPVAAALERVGDADPADLAAVLTMLVLGHRPELAGGAPVAFRFDFEHGCWELLYSHPSFRPTAAGEIIARTPLVPGAEDVRADAIGWLTTAPWTPAKEGM